MEYEAVEIRIPRDEVFELLSQEGKPLTPKDITFSGHHICWLLTHIEGLRLGDWPDVLPDEIWTDQHGYAFTCFQAAVLFAAEVDTRIDMCGADGKLARQYYTDGIEPYGVADYRIIKSINRCVAYCSGFTRRWVNTKRRKGVSYKEWKAKGNNYKRREISDTGSEILLCADGD